MSKIKLFKINTTENGTEKFKTQMDLNRSSVSFIKDSDGIMKHWIYGENGLSFYPYNGDYEIVKNIKDLEYQPL